jgi:hypothetical protein
MKRKYPHLQIVLPSRDTISHKSIDGLLFGSLFLVKTVYLCVICIDYFSAQSMFSVSSYDRHS